MRLVSVPLLFAVFLGCRGGSAKGAGSSRVIQVPEAQMKRYQVFRGRTLVLQFEPGPGPLISTAPPPPPGAAIPPPHPFLHGAASDAMEEGRLRQLLDASSGVNDYIARLTAAGYRVVPQT